MNLRLILNGLTFSVEVKGDRDASPPWEDNECHGLVKAGDFRHFDGARFLSRSHYYDWNATLKKARRECWYPTGPVPPEATPAEQAVEEDYQRLRAYCEGRWWHVGVVVTLLDISGEPTPIEDSLWGLESDDDLSEWAEGMALDLSDQPDVLEFETEARHTFIRVRRKQP